MRPPIEELQALNHEASPLPWCHHPVRFAGGTPHIRGGPEPGSEVVCELRGELEPSMAVQVERNMRLIAATRNALPDLLEYVLKLEGEQKVLVSKAYALGHKAALNEVHDNLAERLNVTCYQHAKED